MAACKRSEFSVDVEGKRSTKETGKKRVPNLDNEFIITTRVEKGLERWKFLQTEIPEKQRKVENGARSKRLEPYKKERDGLVEQMQKDIAQLQSIFCDEYGNAFDRKDKRRTTTGDMRKENRETLSLRSAKSKTDQLKSQLENERKSKEQNLSRLNRRLEKSENEKVVLKLNHKMEIRVHKEEIRKLQERLTIAKAYEEKAKDLEIKCYELEAELARLNRKLDESEKEKVALKLNHKEEIEEYKEEIRKLQERLSNSGKTAAIA